MAVMITPIYAGLLGILLLVLSYLVSRLRRRNRISIGDGGLPSLTAAIRVQGNFTEYVPLAVILLLILELMGLPAWLLHAIGIALVLGRLLHAQGLCSNPGGKSFGRITGILLTWISILVASLALVIHGSAGLLAS